MVMSNGLYSTFSLRDPEQWRCLPFVEPLASSEAVAEKRGGDWCVSREHAASAPEMQHHTQPCYKGTGAQGAGGFSDL